MCASACASACACASECAHVRNPPQVTSRHGSHVLCVGDCQFSCKWLWVCPNEWSISAARCELANQVLVIRVDGNDTTRLTTNYQLLKRSPGKRVYECTYRRSGLFLYRSRLPALFRRSATGIASQLVPPSSSYAACFPRHPPCWTRRTSRNHSRVRIDSVSCTQLKQNELFVLNR